MKTFRDIASDLRSSRSLGVKFYVSNRIQEENGHQLLPSLLDGEIVVKEAQKVLLFPNPIDKTIGIMGSLFVTNFRIFLLPTDGAAEREPPKQKNLLIGDFGIALTNVDAVYQISGSKPRKLHPNTNLEQRIKGLMIVCKNMRVMTLNFEQSTESGKTMAATILHHSFVGRHSLLFAYEYRAPLWRDEMAQSVQYFSSEDDWNNEIKRTCRDGAASWRVCHINRKFEISLVLPKFLVVPHSLTDGDLKLMSNSFRCARTPTWSWSHINGAALVRMADSLPGIVLRKQENIFLENLRGLHPQKRAPIVIELDKCLPSIQDIQHSFVKLREICIPVSKRQFESQDNRFHALLDNCKWMHYVSACLSQAVAAAKQLTSGIAVVLQESDGRDTSALVSSLIQIMLDANSRTITGFQSLLQKEWISLGHPFCSRLGFLRASRNEQSPVFLLFLDCVWQIKQQFSTAFEFSGTYLTTLFDSCHNTLFDTFIFDCIRDRDCASERDELSCRSVWRWNEQFGKDDIDLFRNPLYQLEDILDHRSPKLSLRNVIPNSQIYNLEPWGQCFFRWLPTLGIRQGGQPKLDLVNMWLRKCIDNSIADIKKYTKRSDLEISRRIKPFDKSTCVTLNGVIDDSSILENSILENISTVDSFFPFSSCDNSIINLLADSSTLSDCDSQSILNLAD